MREDAEPAPPFDGDPSWRAVHVLADGTEVVVRPIQPADRDALRDAFRRTSARTRYLRFLGVIGDLDEDMLDYLTQVDQKNHVALVATVASPDLKTDIGAGIARFIRVEGEPSVAEGAITVADGMQRRGIGTLLARELAGAARAAGIRTMRAEVLESNALMRSILAHAGAVGHDAHDGTVAYDLAIAPKGDEHGFFVDVLRGAAQTMAMTIRRLLPPGSSRTPAPSATATAAKRE